jgi:hypothetical protein
VGVYSRLMALELVRFFFAAAVIMAPGVWLAAVLGLGETRLARWTHGSCLGIALAIYLASAVSYFDLRWFYPLWIAGGLILLAMAWRRPVAPETDRSVTGWMILVLLIVAATRYAVAVGRIAPEGVDPPIFLILAKKIQLTHHAIFDWLPFETARLNYPTGGHVLVAVLSSISGIPLHTVFTDLIPLLGVLMTAEVFVFTRRVTGDAAAGIYAALAYGMWAGDGSISFFIWGGLPNELAMLLFLATLSAWLERSPWRVRLIAASLLYAAVILTHHHTLLASGGVIAVVVAWMALRRANRADALLLALSALTASLLDIYFLAPALAKVATLPSTNVFHSEWRLNPWQSIQNTGLVFVAAAAAGIAFRARRPRTKIHPAAACACVALGGMFVACEYVLPIWLSPHWRFPTTVFSPSHFLNDIVCFLAVFAGTAVALVQRELGLARSSVVVMMLIAAVSQIDIWRSMAGGGDLYGIHLIRAQGCIGTD